MPTSRSPLISLALAGLCSLAARSAAAVETSDVGGEPVRIDVTEASSVFYNVDNRNSRVGDVSRSVDDDWGVWYNRLNTQVSWKKFQAGLRLDSAWFYTAPTPTKVALEQLELLHGDRKSVV